MPNGEMHVMSQSAGPWRAHAVAVDCHLLEEMLAQLSTKLPKSSTGNSDNEETNLYSPDFGFYGRLLSCWPPYGLL